MGLGDLFRETKNKVESDHETLKPLDEVVNLGKLTDKGHIISSLVSVPPGRYHVKNNLLIRESATFKLHPGVELYCDDRVCISNKGVMMAEGTDKEDIKVTGYYDQKFGGIVHYGDVSSNSKMSHCDISHSKGLTLLELTVLLGISPKNIKTNHHNHNYGALTFLNSSPKLKQNIIHNNTAYSGAAIMLIGDSSPSIDTLLVKKNIGLKEGAIYNESIGMPYFKHILFKKNVSGSLGGAFTNNGYGLMEDCEFRNNNFSERGGAIGLSKGDQNNSIPIYIINSVFAFNMAENVAGAMHFERSKLHTEGGFIGYNGNDIRNFKDMLRAPFSPDHIHYQIYHSNDVFIANRLKIIGNSAKKGGALAATDVSVNLLNSNVMYCNSLHGDSGIQLLATPFTHKGTIIRPGQNNIAGRE